MNKNSIALFMTCLLIFSACGSAGEQGVQGEQGDKGEKGDAGEISQAAIEAAVEAALTEDEANTIVL